MTLRFAAWSHTVLTAVAALTVAATMIAAAVPVTPIA